MRDFFLMSIFRGFWVHLRSSASVTRNDVNRLYERRLGQFPREGVLAATIAHKEHAQLVGRHCENELQEWLQGLCCASVDSSYRPRLLRIIRLLAKFPERATVAVQRVEIRTALHTHME